MKPYVRPRMAHLYKEGDKINSLTLLECEWRKDSGIRCKWSWRCQCECGQIKWIREYCIERGQISCGCVFIMNRKRGGITKDPEWKIWDSMVRRCSNEEDSSFHNYGGRGIKVCARWRASYFNFISDVGRRPSPKLTLERPDNDGNYEPGNVIWETRHKQSRNTRKNVILSFNGKSLCAKDWAKEIGIGYTTLISRINRGGSIERILSPKRLIRVPAEEEIFAGSE